MPGLFNKRWLALAMGMNLIMSVVAMADKAPLSVFQAKYQTLSQERSFDAVIEPVKQATVSAQTSGRITEINFDVDDFVPKGSVLLRFRNKKQKAALSEAQAGLKEAETRLEDAQLEFERIKGVYAKKLVSKAVYDKTRTTHKTSIQQLDQARARLTQAQEDFDRTVIKAPYAGIVVKRYVEVGETAKVGQALLTGFSMDSIRAIAKVPQSLIGLINPDKGDKEQKKQAYIVYSVIKDKKPGEGKVKQINKIAATTITINPYGDPDTHTFNVRVGLPGGLEGIYPGMFVKVAFIVGEEKHLLVPRQAVVNRSEVTAVYVTQSDGDISFRQIRVGKVFDDDMVEVLSGLDEGEQVVLDPVEAGIRLKEQHAGNAK